ncbi:ATP phosphoribosyltransferase regulatory subunit [Thiolapillus brandeum]|uniref:ATP phosphoribosyltransferase regulatory subunit n=1 Tax=Thiolapillus brandeum TaxID=1076588 RepID=A0A7U6GJU1_9GAMM|nr:ATP phosphoribosyltransferase regulatory subunit [Thiolapillus brandeum]BAO45003.1 ATP phosphoribosyltransferase regulatory subunit [Thiolapillus brandeum]
MSSHKHWLLPEGIDELLPEQAARLEALRRRLLDQFGAWGYELVITPFIEYLDSLLTGAGKDLEHQTFKMTDQISGRLLGIRADITPQAARIDAHQLCCEEPNRLCYIGSVFRTRSDGFSASRSPLQIGAELYGHSGVESDVEILCLMMATLEMAGVENVFLDLGHVGIFQGLARQAALNAEQENALFAALQRKAVPEIRSLVEGFGLETGLAQMFTGLASLNGKADIMTRARDVLAGADAEVHAAMDYLEQAGQHLQSCLPELPIHYDLAELRGYQYQTGLVFAAFVPGSGKEIARGGRYDDVGEKFGRSRPATGFSADLKTLMRFGKPFPMERKQRVFAPAGGDAKLEHRIAELRSQGRVVIRHLPGQPGNASTMDCDAVLVEEGGDWRLKPV